MLRTTMKAAVRGLRLVIVLLFALSVSLGARAAPDTRGATEPPTDEEINQAITRGADFLISVQADDGHFNIDRRPGAIALGMYALLKSGVASDHESVLRALSALARVEKTGTYDNSCMLLALVAHDARQHRDWIEELAFELIEWQRQRGDWAYPAGGADLSNTQFAALGLRAAARAGVSIPVDVWERLASAVYGYHDGKGGFGYSAGGAGTPSMTTAGIGTLAICHAQLAAAKALDVEASRKSARTRQAGLDRLARILVPERSKRPLTRMNYYTLYGLERVGAFEGVKRIGELDWYRWGARILLDGQKDDGGWPDFHSRTVSSAFALLFLTRASRPAETGVESAKRRLVRLDSPPDIHAELEVTGDDVLTLWISGVSQAALDKYEWPGEEGRGLRVERVSYMIDGRVAVELEADSDQPASDQRFAAQYHPRVAGEFLVSAQVRVVAPPTVLNDGSQLDGLVHLIRSATFSYRIAEVEPRWLREQADDRAKNLVAPPVGAHASSELEERIERRVERASAERAVDRRVLSSWLCDPKDEHPRLSLNFARRVEADTILISHARTVPYVPGFYRRALAVSVVVNGRDEYEVPMFPDERRKGRLVLPDVVAIKSLELTIPLSVPGKNSAALGLAEVELQDSTAQPDKSRPGKR